VIFEFLLQFIEKDVTGRIVYRMFCFFLGRNFVSGLLCTLKH